MIQTFWNWNEFFGTFRRYWTMLCILFLTVFALGADPYPQGCYKGSYEGIASIQVIGKGTLTGGTMNVTGSIFGEKEACSNEPYSYSASVRSLLSFFANSKK